MEHIRTIVGKVECSAQGRREREIAKIISQMPDVQSVYGVFGPSDIAVVARCKDRESARDLVMDIDAIEGVRSTNITVIHTAEKESTYVEV